MECSVKKRHLSEAFNQNSAQKFNKTQFYSIINDKRHQSIKIKDSTTSDSEALVHNQISFPLS